MNALGCSTTGERSVIASAAKAAKMCAPSGGVTIRASERPYVPAQLIWLAPKKPRSLQRRLFELTTEMEAFADQETERMLARGACPPVVHAARLRGPAHRPHVVLPLEYDTRDAMGANVVTRAGERLGHWLTTHGLPAPDTVICTNATSGWLVQAKATWRVDDPARARRVADLSHFARHDPERAATHNKGFMNGLSAVAIATGQDDRAIAACVHAFATRKGEYRPISTFTSRDAADGTASIRGVTALFVPCGTVGGATALPYYSECLSMLGSPTASDLAAVMTAVGLVQNFAALWSLVGEGIAASHERLKL
jgi:hydroxymethylglutaryl-CoA reductase